ncbi:class I SAM-dependent methyltransferase [Curtobacterium sp. AB451]|uniref:class I SAM-dependent methyltransferase n=1 Tax=Curtobacterium sp. AB451 TaxID=3422306 RepID=UPI003D332602
MTRTADGPAGEPGAVRAEQDHRKYRRPEPSFVRAVATALGDARTVLEVGDGAVSSVPADRAVTAATSTNAIDTDAASDTDVTTDADATDGSGTWALPFPDDRFDAAVVTFPVEGWVDPERGLAEVRRVTRGPIVVLTSDPDRVPDFWLAEYAPEVTAAEAGRYPPVGRITEALAGDTVTTTPLPIPFTCVDGFSEAYYARPERLLDAAARRADPAWGLVDELTARRSVAALRNALDSGDWDRAHGALRTQPSRVGALVLVTAVPPRA